MIELKAVLQGW